MGAYVKNLDVFHCPEDTDPTVNKDMAYWQAQLADVKIGPSSYILNALQSFAPAWGVSVPSGAFPIDANYTQVSLASLTRPADLVALSEGRYDFVAPYHGIANTEIALASYITSGRSMEPQDHIQIPNESTIRLLTQALPGGPNPFLYRTWHKHSGGSNFAFVDGHVKFCNPSQLLSGEHWIGNWPY